jgi:hypothetical protein
MVLALQHHPRLQQFKLQLPQCLHYSTALKYFQLLKQAQKFIDYLLWQIIIFINLPTALHGYKRQPLVPEKVLKFFVSL